MKLVTPRVNPIGMMGDQPLILPNHSGVSNSLELKNILDGYVPYTGAVTDVNLGNHFLKTSSYLYTGVAGNYTYLLNTSFQQVSSYGSLTINTGYNPSTGNLATFFLQAPSALTDGYIFDGKVNAVSFTGDGSGLTGLKGTASKMFTPANPAGVLNTTYKMQGLGAVAIPFIITPSLSGIVEFNISFLLSAGVTAGSTSVMQVSYGTGAAPANQAAATGTVIGTTAASLNSVSPQPQQPFSKHYIVTGLSVGTAYWFDVQLKANFSTYTALMTNIQATLKELPY